MSQSCLSFGVIHTHTHTHIYIYIYIYIYILAHLIDRNIERVYVGVTQLSGSLFFTLWIQSRAEVRNSNRREASIIFIFLKPEPGIDFYSHLLSSSKMIHFTRIKKNARHTWEIPGWQFAYTPM